MTVTQSARGRANRRKGVETEQRVARYLRSVGFPHAERAERNGWRTADHVSADPMDITGVPGIVWSVKNDQRNQVGKWIDEAERVRARNGVDLAVLVVRRDRKADPAQWWAWVSLPLLVNAVVGTGIHDFGGYVCLELGDLVPDLHRAGYGDDEYEAEATA